MKLKKRDCFSFLCFCHATALGCYGTSPMVPFRPPVTFMPVPTPVVNIEPTIDVQTQLNVSENAHVPIDASGSIDPDGTIVSFDWQQLEGAEVFLSNANKSIVSFTSPYVAANEDIVLQLVVTDNDNAQVSTAITISIENGELIRPNLTAKLNESGLKLDWTESFAAQYRVLYSIDGQIPNQMFTTDLDAMLTNLKTGRYTFYVEAYDELGNSLISPPQSVLVL